MATRVLPRVVLASGAPGAHGARFAPRRPSAARRFARVAGLPRRVSPPPSPRAFPDSARPVRSRRSARPPAAVDENRTAATRARLDAIREEDEGDVEDPGERGGVDMFSGLNLTPEALAYWESQNAFFFPRLLLVSMTALGLAASIPQSLGGIFRGDDDAVSVLVTNVAFFALAAGFTAFDLKRRRIALARLQRELAIGDMRVIQRDKFRNERVFPLASLRQAARVALVYGDAEKVARDLAAATPFRRRLEQSRILVVPVVERGSRSSSRESAAADNLDPAAAVSDVGPGRWELLKDVVLAWPGAGAGRWLAWPTRNDAWAGYFRRLLESAGVADPASGGYVTVGVNGQVRGSGVGSPAWDVLLSTFPRNRPGNKADAAAESAWRAATVDGGTVEDAAAPGADVRADGAARPIGTTLELPREGAAAEVLEVHDAFYAALRAGDVAGLADVGAPAREEREKRRRGLDEGGVGGGGDVDGARRDVRRASTGTRRRARGGRLGDGAPGGPPTRGLRLSDVDVTVERDLATVTVLETVANGATLLATQAYERDPEEGGR